MFLPWNAGTENAFLTYAKELNYLGFNVINLVHPKAAIIKNLEENNLKYIKTKFLGRFGKIDIFSIFYFKYLLKKHKINIVFSHQGRITCLFKKSCSTNVKLVSVNHGHSPKHAVGTDLAITLNSQIYEKVIALGQKKEKTALIANGIKIDQEFKEYVINKNKEFVIGSFGRFSYEKGYDLMIEAFKILDEKGIKFIAMIGGSGDEEEKLKNLVEKYNLQKKVNFTGWVSNKEEFLRKVDLFLLPSRREEFPLTPLESMKYCVPVLSTKNFGCLDLIEDGKNGFLTELENPKDMAKKLEFLINNQNLLPQVTKNAFEKLLASFSDEAFRKKLLYHITSL